MKMHTILPAAALLVYGVAISLAQNAPAAKPAQPAAAPHVATAASVPVVQTPAAPADPALLADPVTLDDVHKIFDVMGIHKQFDVQINGFIERARTHMAAELKKANPKLEEAETQKGVEAGVAVLKAGMSKIDYDELLEKQMLPATRNVFTHTELQQTIHFFESPAGAKFLEKSGVIFNQTWLQAFNSTYPVARAAQQEASKASRKAVGLPEVEPEPPQPTVGKPTVAPAPAAPAATPKPSVK